MSMDRREILKSPYITEDEKRMWLEIEKEKKKSTALALIILLIAIACIVIGVNSSGISSGIWFSVCVGACVFLISYICIIVDYISSILNKIEIIFHNKQSYVD